MSRELLLVPVDYSGCAAGVCDAAADLARRLGAAALLVHVTQLPAGVPAETVITTETAPGASAGAVLDADAQSNLDQLAALFDGVTTSTLVAHGAPAQRILELADEHGASMIVMGTRGRKGIARALLGSVCEDVVRNADVPVLTVRSGDPSSHPGRTTAQRAVDAESTG